MVLLTTLAFMFAIGFACWITGQIFSYTGVAAIGAILIFTAGSGVALTGLEVRTGEVQNNACCNDSEVVYQYDEVTFGGIFNSTVLRELAVGGLIMLLSATMLSQTLNDVIE